MTTGSPEDFAAEAEPDETTRLSSRNAGAEPDSSPEPDDATQLATRRRTPAEAPDDADDDVHDDATVLATRRQAAVDPDPDVTQMASRRRETAPGVHHNNDVSERDVVTAVPRDFTSLTTDPDATRAAHPPFDAGNRIPVAFPPGESPAAMHAREGGFGARTEAYRPREMPTPLPLAPQAFEEQLDAPRAAPSATAMLMPIDAQRRREAAHRAAVTKAVAVGIGVLVLGTAAVIGIIVLLGGLL
ncbi:hypothetical protein [Demequina aurantiaca]|uniref:hypothetical protein n=1 Tax=Demequina aurantiaca TaxID=676200 RepID=UPI003D35681F